MILAPIFEDKVNNSYERLKENMRKREAIKNGKQDADKKKGISRKTCKAMNKLAEYICSDKFNSKKKQRK